MDKGHCVLIVSVQGGHFSDKWFLSGHPTMFYCRYTTYTFRIRSHLFRELMVVNIMNVISFISEGMQMHKRGYSTSHPTSELV